MVKKLIINSMQIQRIRQESQEMIDKVINHKEKMTAKVEDFHTKLMTKEDGLKKSQAELTCLLKDGHVTEKIRQKKRITEELERHDADKLVDCELADPPTLIHTGNLSIHETILLPFWGIYKVAFVKRCFNYLESLVSRSRAPVHFQC